MNKTLLVLRNEIVNTVTRKSFLFTAIGLPLLAFLISMGIGLLNSGGSAAGADAEAGASTQKVEGYVDQAGLIQSIPEDLPSGAFVGYPDEASARRALGAGEIDAFYIIPEDYVAVGTLYYIDPDARPFGLGSQSWLMRWVLFVNLLGGDVELAARVRTPMNIQVTALSPEAQRDTDSMAAFWIPYAVTMIFYFVILMSASLLMQSVSKEKQNRVMEILMASVSPRQLLAGKIAGLGIAGLVQTLIWAGTGYTLLRLAGRTFSLPPGLELPPTILLWGVVFFLLGYALYASLMAAMGAMVPNMREASQATIAVIWPLIVPLFFINVLVEKPGEALSTGLSMFPLTSPIAMMTRMASSDVPLWQPLLAVALLLATAVLVVRAVAGMFRAQTLLSGQAFSVKRFFAALLGRV